MSLEYGKRPASGYFISGRVNVLKATAGWRGGLMAVAAGSGYTVNIDVNIETLDDGINILSRQYNIKKSVPSDALDTWLIGGGITIKELPKVSEVALRELLRTQILPDIHASLNDI